MAEQKHATETTSSTSATDLTARDIFPSAPHVTDHFNDAATKPAEQATTSQTGTQTTSQTEAGSHSSTTQQHGQRTTPELAPHLRPKDKELAKTVHRKVAAQAPDPSPW